MLLVLTGSSCSGKTTLARRCARLDRLEVHDFDEWGVPSGADLRWRQATLERWIRVAERDGTRGADTLLTAQSPLGEVLACPSATRLDGLAVALLDVPDRERWVRLERRDPGRWDDDEKRSFIGWAGWHRAHVDDPGAAPEVITRGSSPEMAWSRWSSWEATDARWCTRRIETGDPSVEQATEEVLAWIAESRAQLADGRLPLAAGWASA